MALWQHQRDGATFVDGKRGALLWWGMGCLSAITILKVKRNGVEMSLHFKDLYTHFNGKDQYKIKTLIDNKLQWSEIDNVSYSGRKELIKIGFKSDNSIECTLDHKIMMTDGQWVEAGRLLINDSVYTTCCEDIVTSIFKINNGRTYDITMKHSNNFVANGIVVHNSGKSYGTINIIKESNAKYILILCPKSVVLTWIKQIEEHADGDFLIVAPTGGSVKKKAEQIEAIINYNKNKPKPIVVILNYEACWRSYLGPVRDAYKNIRDNGLIKKIPWDLIVCDEIHRIKSPGSRISKFIVNVKTKQKLGLSGTPFSTPLAVYGIFRFLDKDLFGTSYQRFKMKYMVWGGFENKQIVEYVNQEDMNERIHSITHRVKVEDVIELPPAQHITAECELNNKARKAYDHFKKEAILQFESGAELTAANVLTKMLRLSQICSGIIKDDDGISHLVDTAKLDTLKDLIVNIDEPIVIFTRFRIEVEQIEKMITNLPKEGYTKKIICKIVGGCDEREKFANEEADVAIVNIGAGSTGLNELVRARYTFYYSLSYNSLDYEQSLARTRRQGSNINKTVFYYHIVAKNTMDEVIMNAIHHKINIVDSVLEHFKK